MNYHLQIRVRTQARMTPKKREQTAGWRNTPAQGQNVPGVTRKQGGSSRSKNESMQKIRDRRRKGIGAPTRSIGTARQNYGGPPRRPMPQPKTSARRRKKPR